MLSDNSSTATTTTHSTDTPEETWTTVITPHQGWTNWRLRQLWRYRDLISLFVWRDFVSVYKQTILGPAWHVIQPLLTTLTYTLIFGRIARLPTDGVSPFLFYMAGTVAWSYFSNCLVNTSRTFVGNAHLMGKVYFHRLTIPLSIVISGLISFGIQFTIFLVALILSVASGHPVHVTSWILLAPLFVFMLAGFGLGGGVIVSALTTRYRDLGNLVTFGVQLLMYATPVIYPVSVVPAKYRWIMGINPLTPIIEGFRSGFLGVGSSGLGAIAVSFCLMVAVLAIALMLFTHVERTFMDTV